MKNSREQAPLFSSSSLGSKVFNNSQLSTVFAIIFVLVDVLYYIKNLSSILNLLSF